jgi:hypothetical protein
MEISDGAIIGRSYELYVNVVNPISNPKPPLHSYRVTILMHNGEVVSLIQNIEISMQVLLELCINIFKCSLFHFDFSLLHLSKFSFTYKNPENIHTDPMNLFLTLHLT